MTKPELAALAARVEAGSEPSLSLLADVALALGWQFVKDGFHVPYWMRPGGAPQDGATLPNWLTSLDAVVALIAERLPGGAEWSVNTNKDGCFASLVCGQWADDYAPSGGSPTKRKRTREEILEDDAQKRIRQHFLITSAIPRTPARALLASLLRALAAQQQDRTTNGKSNDC